MSQSSIGDFQSFNLPEPICKAIKTLGYTAATDIQAHSIPIALQGKDLIACAQTGSGKTAAYTIPLVCHLIQNPQAKALVLAPTRELASQIADVVRGFTRFIKNHDPVLLIGGVDMRKQIHILKKNPRIVIGTPGRVNDHLSHKTLKLDATRFFVLDEGDRMLDMGFAPQIERILKSMTGPRQTLLFSATLPPKVRSLAERYMKTPEHIQVGPQSVPVEKIQQKTIQTTHQTKFDVLMDELNTRKGAVIVFAKTRRGTDRLANDLGDYGYTVSRIHGDRSQAQRNSAIKQLREGQVRILVATDVAARGLDIPHVAHVVNYDLPMFAEDYVHRIGRTARAGASGEALNLVVPDDLKNWIKIARKYKIELPKELSSKQKGNYAKPGFKPARKKRPFGPPSGRSKFRSKSF